MYHFLKHFTGKKINSIVVKNQYVVKNVFVFMYMCVCVSVFAGPLWDFNSCLHVNFLEFFFFFFFTQHSERSEMRPLKQMNAQQQQRR